MSFQPVLAGTARSCLRLVLLAPHLPLVSLQPTTLTGSRLLGLGCALTEDVLKVTSRNEVAVGSTQGALDAMWLCPSRRQMVNKTRRHMHEGK